jgi:integrase
MLAERVKLMPKQVVTDRFLKALKPAPAGKRVVVWDGAQPNLCVRVTDKGSVSFVVVRRLPGKAQPTWHVLGRYPTLSLGEARTKARETLGLITEGHDPQQVKAEQRREAAEKAKADETDTFAYQAERFIRRYEQRGLRAAGHISARIRSELVPVWGHRKLAAIKHRDIVETLEAIVDRGATTPGIRKRNTGGPHAARHTFAACQLMFGWAFRRELIDTDPTARIVAKELHGLDHQALQRDRVLSDEELRLVWQAADQTPYPFGNLVKLLLLTGARLREWSDASWDEIDLGAATLTIPTSRMKGKIAHVIPLCPAALEIVAELPRFTGDYVFTTTAGARPISGFSKFREKFNRTLAGLGEIDPFVIHDLRRTCRTGLSSLGVLPMVAELVIGHVQQGIAAVYDRYRYVDEKRAALSLWEQRLLAIVDPRPEPTNVVRMPKKVRV